MNSPLASVIVPVYNVSPYLSECAASICGQTYSNLEIILVDDGSSDGSGALCDELAEKDPRVQVIHQENRGVSAARNAGLNAASGTYIYFVDGDDWVKETLVEETAAVMERGGYDCCTWGHTLEDGESVYFGRRREIVFRFPAEEEKRRFLCRWVVPCRLDWSVCNRVFRREIIQRNGLRFAEEQALFEDLDFSFRYLACCQSLYYLPKGLYAYRQHGASALHISALQAWSANLLRMVWRQDRELSGQPLFQPFYVYGGTVLAVLLDNFMKGRTAEQGLTQAAACLRACGEWEYLLEQAGMAVEDRRGIQKICGRRLGGQVFGFYWYLRTGDPAAYLRANRVQVCYTALRDLKNKLPYGWRK